jgi:hypothetical protein
MIITPKLNMSDFGVIVPSWMYSGAIYPLHHNMSELCSAKGGRKQNLLMTIEETSYKKALNLQCTNTIWTGNGLILIKQF